MTRRPTLSNTPKLMFLGAATIGSLSFVGSLFMVVYWSNSADPAGVGWLLILFFIATIPITIIGAFVGSMIFGFVGVLANLIQIDAGPFSYALLSLLPSVAIAFALVGLKDVLGDLHPIPVLFPLVIFVVGLFVGATIGRSQPTTN